MGSEWTTMAGALGGFVAGEAGKYTERNVQEERDKAQALRQFSLAALQNEWAGEKQREVFKHSDEAAATANRYSREKEDREREDKLNAINKDLEVGGKLSTERKVREAVEAERKADEVQASIDKKNAGYNAALRGAQAEEDPKYTDNPMATLPDKYEPDASEQSILAAGKAKVTRHADEVQATKRAAEREKWQAGLETKVAVNKAIQDTRTTLNRNEIAAGKYEKRGGGGSRGEMTDNQQAQLNQKIIDTNTKRLDALKGAVTPDQFKEINQKVISAGGDPLAIPQSVASKLMTEATKEATANLQGKKTGMIIKTIPSDLLKEEAARLFNQKKESLLNPTATRQTPSTPGTASKTYKHGDNPLNLNIPGAR